MAENILVEAAGAGGSAPRRSRFVRQLARRPLTVIAGIVLVVIVIMSLLAPVLVPAGPYVQDLANTFAAPSASHPLGTDHLGRDVMTRLLYGGQLSLPAAALATGFAMLIGIPTGLAVGYYSGWLDRAVAIVTDTVMTFPGVILAISLVAVIGNTLTNAMLALGLVFSPAFVRLARAEVLATRNENFIVAARLLGYSTPRIMFRHILPNIVAPLIIQTFLSFSFALLAQAGLAFLGIGVKPPAPAWGSMLADSATYMAAFPFQVVPAGLIIALTALAASLLGDGVRDALGAGVRASRVRRRRIRHDPAVDLPGVAPDQRSLLAIRDLTIGYEENGTWTDIVHDVSLTVEKGQTCGLVGESGSGKSLTAAAILGLLPAPLEVRAGMIAVDGEDLAAMSEAQLRRRRGRAVAMIFQDPLASLNPTMTIGAQLIQTIRLHEGSSRAAARKTAIELLRTVEIREPEHRLNAYPHEFSGGMAQRVMIALALAGSPQLLVADEPTTALDVTVQVEILDLLRRLQTDTGMGILFITHDLAVVADICDSAAVMFQGRILETSTVEKLLTAPDHVYTKQLIAGVAVSAAKGAE